MYNDLSVFCIRRDFGYNGIRKVTEMSIGKNIKQIRIDNNLTQKQLAKIAGVTDKAVSMWEMEKREPRMGAIQKIADFFGVSKSKIIDEPPFDYPSLQKNIKSDLTNYISIDGFSFEYYNTEFKNVYHPSDNVYLLQTKDNMAPFILKQDKLTVEISQTVKNNSCYAVIIDSNPASIHRIVLSDNGLELLSDNPYFPKQFFSLSEQNRVKVIGKVTKIIREL